MLWALVGQAQLCAFPMQAVNKICQQIWVMDPHQHEDLPGSQAPPPSVLAAPSPTSTSWSPLHPQLSDLQTKWVPSSSLSSLSQVHYFQAILFGFSLSKSSCELLKSRHTCFHHMSMSGWQAVQLSWGACWAAYCFQSCYTGWWWVRMIVCSHHRYMVRCINASCTQSERRLGSAQLYTVCSGLFNADPSVQAQQRDWSASTGPQFQSWPWWCPPSAARISSAGSFLENLVQDSVSSSVACFLALHLKEVCTSVWILSPDRTLFLESQSISLRKTIVSMKEPRL